MSLKRTKKQNGITLIALVITIIVLLILAAVTIGALTGDNGILKNAAKAKEETEKAEEDELRRLTALEAATNLENTTYIDKNDVTVTIPAGFAVSQVEGENTIAEGMVIIDKNGNEFVWIPVDNSSDEVFNRVFQRQEGYQDGNPQEILSSYEEADSTGINSEITETTTTQQEAIEMYESVKTYGGFYIGRYETGKDEDGNIVIRKGATPYNNVPWSVTGSITEDEEIDGTENGAVEQARYFATANVYTSVTSTLCYGVQWDSVMNFIDPKYITEAEVIGKPSCDETSYVRDSTDKGWCSQDDVTSTGYYQIKNIYDLAGNVKEWTMESFGAYRRTNRGGTYGDSGFDFPCSTRTNNLPDYTRPYIGFRITLYLQD